MAAAQKLILEGYDVCESEPQIRNGGELLVVEIEAIERNTLKGVMSPYVVAELRRISPNWWNWQMVPLHDYIRNGNRNTAWAALTRHIEEQELLAAPIRLESEAVRDVG